MIALFLIRLFTTNYSPAFVPFSLLFFFTTYFTTYSHRTRSNRQQPPPIKSSFLHQSRLHYSKPGQTPAFPFVCTPYCFSPARFCNIYNLHLGLLTFLFSFLPLFGNPISNLMAGINNNGTHRHRDTQDRNRYRVSKPSVSPIIILLSTPHPFSSNASRTQLFGQFLVFLQISSVSAVQPSLTTPSFA